MQIRKYGQQINQAKLAEIVSDLYASALKPSSRRTYQTGQRAYYRFSSNLPTSCPKFPFHRKLLSPTELRLAFFMASLVLKPTIKSCSTILGYETHVKYLFRAQGCDPEEYSTAFLGQVRTGIRKSYPSQGDKRTALILPRYMDNLTDQHEPLKREKLRFATILAFIGMLRPHTFPQLQLQSFTLVLQNEHLISLCPSSFNHPSNRRIFQERSTLLGFYISFASKTMADAKAYYPNLSSPHGPYSNMCPVNALLALMRKQAAKKGFLAALGRGSNMEKYLQNITNSPTPISPYALRIGGRTWYLTRGLDRQFVDYLGTWVSPDASATYFRARPAAVLNMLRRFYDKTKKD